MYDKLKTGASSLFSGGASALSKDQIQEKLLAAVTSSEIWEVKRYANMLDPSEKEDGDILSHALIKAIKEDKKSAIQTLITFKVNMNVKDEYGYTPLMHAIISGVGEDIITILLEGGAKATVKNNEGKTALEMVPLHYNWVYYNEDTGVAIARILMKAVTAEISDKVIVDSNAVEETIAPAVDGAAAAGIEEVTKTRIDISTNIAEELIAPAVGGAAAAKGGAGARASEVAAKGGAGARAPEVAAKGGAGGSTRTMIEKASKSEEVGEDMVETRDKDGHVAKEAKKRRKGVVAGRRR